MKDKNSKKKNTKKCVCNDTKDKNTESKTCNCSNDDLDCNCK